MDNEDIEFEILNKLGNKVNCVIIASIPIDENTINIIYKREDEADDVFRYGKIVKEEDSYIIKKDLSADEQLELKLTFNDEIMNIARKHLNKLEEE